MANTQRGCNVLSQTVVGWLLVAAALVTFVAGVGMRVVIARKREAAVVQRVVRGFRETGFARVLFGPIANDALDDDELDQMFVMPAIVIGCGLCLTAVFLFGYGVIS